MHIKIYQINLKRNPFRVKFCGLQETQNILRSHGQSALIDPAMYDEVYDGEVDCKDLDGIYEAFNINHPPFHRGHSLSVSDIVQVLDAPELAGRIRFYKENEQSEEIDYADSETYNRAIADAREAGKEIQAVRLSAHHVPSVNTGFYFCDTVGFQKINFNPALTHKPDNLLRVVAVELGKPAYEAEVADEFRAFQQAVRGKIEVSYPFGENAVVISNRDSKILEMDENRTVNGEMYAGTMFIIGDGGDGDFCSLTDEQVQEYLSRFSQPEFTEQNEGISEDMDSGINMF